MIGGAGEYRRSAVAGPGGCGAARTRHAGRRGRVRRGRRSALGGEGCLEDAEVSSHPAGRQLESGNPPTARGSLEPIRVIPVNGLVAIASAVRVVMPGPNVCDTCGVIIVFKRDHMIGDHVLGCLERLHPRSGPLDKIVGLDTDDGLTEAVTKSTSTSSVKQLRKSSQSWESVPVAYRSWTSLMSARSNSRRTRVSSIGSICDCVI